MKKRIKFYLIVAGIIVVFDAIAAGASRTVQVDYAKFVWGSYILYVAANYFGCKHFDLPSGIVAGFVAGLSDSTVGWLLSSALQPYIPFAQPKYTPLIVCVVITTVSLMAACFGLVGSLLFKIVKRTSRLADA